MPVTSCCDGIVHIRSCDSSGTSARRPLDDGNSSRTVRHPEYTSTRAGSHGRLEGARPPLQLSTGPAGVPAEAPPDAPAALAVGLRQVDDSRPTEGRCSSSRSPRRHSKTASCTCMSCGNIRRPILRALCSRGSVSSQPSPRVPELMRRPKGIAWTDVPLVCRARRSASSTLGRYE